MAANTLRTAGLALAGLALTALPAFADHDRSSHRDGRSSGRVVEQARSVEVARPVAREAVVSHAAAPRYVAPHVVGPRAVAPAVVAPRVVAPAVVAPHAVAPRYYGYGYGPRYYGPRYVAPVVVNVAPYRPYVYHWHPAVSFYFGTGVYPYSYAMPPAAYLSVQPGRVYGGVRITDAPRDAQVFADGYYMGVVNDFDGIFQHMNLEAGPHHIEVVEQGFAPVAFDVNVQPGETTTFRAQMQPAQS
jgi:hypothetical protein